MPDMPFKFKMCKLLSYSAGVYTGELSRNDGGHMEHYVIEDEKLALYDPNSNSVEYYQIG